jgi:hypothetical protein
MAIRVNKSSYIRTPHGGFKRNSVKSVTPTDSGVIVIDDSNQMIFWHEEPDPVKARKISKAIMDAVIEGTAVDWSDFYEEAPLDNKIPNKTK